jgi:hypothetical protein
MEETKRGLRKFVAAKPRYAHRIVRGSKPKRQRLVRLAHGWQQHRPRFQHGQTHRVRVSVVVTDTRKSGEFARLDAQAVLNLENLYPKRVLRASPAPGDTHSVGRVTSVITGNVNLAWRQSQNWNTAVGYAWTQCLGGRLDVYGRWTWFPRFDVQVLPASPIVDELRYPDGATSGLLAHRLNFGASWSNRVYGFGPTDATSARASGCSPSSRAKAATGSTPTASSTLISNVTSRSGCPGKNPATTFARRCA